MSGRYRSTSRSDATERAVRTSSSNFVALAQKVANVSARNEGFFRREVLRLAKNDGGLKQALERAKLWAEL